MKSVWLFVGYDRHVDDTYHACENFLDACARADEFMAAYGARYKWVREDEYELVPTEIGTWAYKHSTGFDEGPRVHVELIGWEPGTSS